MTKTNLKAIILLTLLISSIGLSGCGLLYNTNGNAHSDDEYVTGAWKEGSFWCGDYQINLVCPEAGHPSGSMDSDWSTGCKLEDGTSVNVDFYSKEGSLEDRIAEIENEGIAVAEGVLWDNPCSFYVDDIELVTVVFMEVDSSNYIQVEFISWESEVVPFEDIPDEFTLEIESGF